MNIIYDVEESLQKKAFSNNYIDTMHAAMRTVKDITSYSLESLSNYYGLDTEGEHRALKDCYLTKDCYENIYRDFGNSAFVSYSSSRKSGHYQVHFSEETIALQEMHTMIENIMDDGVVTVNELKDLSYWMDSHIELQGNYPFDVIFKSLDAIFADGLVTKDEICEIKSTFSDFVDPVQGNKCCEDNISIEGKHICITGDFDFGSRDRIIAFIEQYGGIADKGVKRATEYLIVGAKGSESWKTNKFGGKIQKAMELREKGFDIKIMQEEDFIKAIGDERR